MFQNSWNVRDKHNRRGRRGGYPAGLQGKQIGLYFKNLNKGTSRNNLMIKLILPPSVLTYVKYNLRSLDKIAKKRNINVPQTKRIKQTEVHNKQGTDWSGDIEVSDGCTLIPRYAQHNEEIIPKVETEPSTSVDNLPIKTEVPDVVPKLEPDALSSDFIPIKKVKSDRITTEKQLIPEMSFATDNISIKTEKSEVESIEEPGISGASDFIPIITDGSGNRKEYFTYSNDLAGHRILSLRGGGDYKYGYEDIIKGSFTEKLDESLAKGISINLSNSEINDLSFALYEDFSDMLRRSRYKSMLKFREKLPTFKKSKELLHIINNNQVVIISGETGCGKSTQVPQIILDDAILNKRGANVKILVTQPRRIAASSLAARVSNERSERIGNSVGYAVRLEKVDARPRGSIMFCTTGVLLADIEVNQGLTNYSHVILDEVHERDTHVDLSMCMLKQVLKKRKDLKLILMSATLDAERLSSYFGNCPTMHIEGLAYPVKDIYLEEILQMTKFHLPPLTNEQRNVPKWKKFRNKDKNAAAEEMQKDILYKSEISRWLESKKHKLDRDVYDTLKDSRIENLNISLVLLLLTKICKGEPGAILVFLPGISEITNLMKKMNQCKAFPSDKYQIYPLHSKLPTLEQHAIFERPPKDKRKIIIATNIAETSITIDDIVYVVDCGKIKINGLNIEKNISTLKVEWVSQANLRQRRGRSGRCQPGICYHLLTSYRAEQLPISLLPELQRSNLLEAVLTIKRLRLGKALDALTMVPDSPDPSTIKSAVKHLQQCGALDDKETLTPLGWHLARLPLHPAAGKLVLLGALFGCLDRAASVAAVWSFKDPFLLVIEKETEIKNIKRKLALGEPSDHVALSEAIIQWEYCGRRSKKSFAYEHFLSNSTLELLSDMKVQLGDNLKNMGFLPSGSVKSFWENRNSNNLSLFKAIVAASLYPNIASVAWKNLNSMTRYPSVMVRTPEDGKISIHPSSLMVCHFRHGVADSQLCNKPGANWLVYWLKLRSSDLFLIDVTCVYTLPILFFGELQVTDAEENNPNDCFISISTIKVRCKKETADILFQLRSLLDYVLATKVTSSNNSSMDHNEFEELVLNAVIKLITAEDERAEYLDIDLSESETSESDYGGNYCR